MTEKPINLTRIISQINAAEKTVEGRRKLDELLESLKSNPEFVRECAGQLSLLKELEELKKSLENQRNDAVKQKAKETK